MPLDGALYISNGRKRHGTSTPRVLSGLGDLMAFTISNPFYMNRRKRRGSTSKAKAAKRRQRDAKGRFLSKGRSRSKSRRRALTTGKRRAASRKGRMTVRQMQALARRHGFVAQVRRKDRKRKMTDEQKAKLAAGRAAYNEKRRRASASKRYAGVRAAAEQIKAAGGTVGYLPKSSPEEFGARYSSAAEMAAAGEVRAYENRSRRNKSRRNSRTRRNGLYERGLNVLAQAPYGVGRIAVLGAEIATAVGVHLLAAKGINALADTSSDLAAARNAVAPFGFTLMGLGVKYGLQPTLDLTHQLPVVGGFVKAAQQTLISDASLGEVAELAFMVGVALDAYRYFKGTSSTFGALNYGDGTAYEIVPYTNQYAPMANANVMYGAIEGGGLSYGSLVYGDADLSDAAHCGTDLSGAELSAARSGMNAYATRFPSSGSAATRVAGRPSVNAGREGYRWGWLIKLVGFEKFQQIAALPAGQRCRVIAQLRLQAMQSLQSIINGSEMVLPDHSSPVNSSPTMAGLDYSGLSYNGFVYAGV
jgi:hypothetical protein